MTFFIIGMGGFVMGIIATALYMVPKYNDLVDELAQLRMQIMNRET